MPSTEREKSDTQNHGGGTPTNIETVGLVVDNVDADFKLMPITLDEVRSDEVLVEMAYSGICHTVTSSLAL